MNVISVPFHSVLVSRLRHRIQIFCKEERSSAAVEFAIIGNTLMLLLVGLLLMGIFQFWQMTLDDAVRGASRDIQIGTVTSSSQFINAVCNEFGAVAPCNSNNLQFEVQTNTGSLTFGGITPANVSSAGVLTPKNEFPFMPFAQTGTPVLVQVAYELPITLPLVPVVLESGNATDSLISTVAVMAYGQ